MEIATGAISSLLPKLGDLIKKEYKLQKSVRGDIMFLEAELEAMQTFLVMVASAPIDRPPNAQVKLWARDVKELSYDLEDNIDRFLLRVDHASDQLHGLRGFIDRSLNLLTKVNIRREIATNIKEIRTRIREVSERRDRYKIDSVTAKPTLPNVDSLRLSTLHKKATELIGTEEQANVIAKMLMEDGEPATTQLKVVSIVGIGGLGKTTLANVVYEKLRDQFDCGAFVSISLHPMIDQIFKSMLHQIDSDRYRNIYGETWDEMGLINELRDLLSSKRYFIVIDDIWKQSTWVNIMRALNKSGRGSRIITTTRILDVAAQTGSVYRIKPLSPVGSKKLFYLRIFGTEDRHLPMELAKESDNILRKCGGVPLAIITIGSMLASKKETENTSEYWSKVCKSMGSGLENSSDVNSMRSILSVSYHDLPLHLRTCFLYLSLYPEDYEIRTDHLIWKWIGEGFVLKKQGKGMFEVGEDYIHELINRSLIQTSSIDNLTNKASSFQIHDMVLDLISFLSNEEHFLTKLGAHEPERLPNKLRRLSLQTREQEDNKMFREKNFSHVRSLIVFSESFNLITELSRFPVLRVLDLRKAHVGNDHFKDICNLFHLRYLAFGYHCITEIPDDIGNLTFLQVLYLDGTEIVKFPSSFVQLRQLVYLKFHKLETVPDWLGYLKSLQELIGDIHLNSPTTLHVLCRLTQLRRVSLFFDEWNESYEKTFLLWLSSMVNIKYLSIDGRINIDFCSSCDILSPIPQQLQTIKILGAICSVPRWMTSLCSLSILHISLLTLGEEDLQILGSIPSLCHLAIKVQEPTKSRDKKLLVIGDINRFLCLTKFEIANVEAMFVQGAMQKLQTLKISGRESGDQFDNTCFGLENLSSLKHVFVDLILCHSKPKEVEAALQKAVDMNPNKPKMTLITRCVLKSQKNLEDRRTREQAFRSVAKLDGIESISIESKQGKLTVCGMVDPTAIIDKLKEIGIAAEPWDFGAHANTSGIKQQREP